MALQVLIGSACSDNACTHKVKYEAFTVPEEVFEYTLINALQQVGVNALP